MKVVKSKENYLEFDNGLVLEGAHRQDCCEYNYLDFEQLPVGTELKDMDMQQFIESIKLKKDGFIVKDIFGIPKWVQARSGQWGYYTTGVSLAMSMNGKAITISGVKKHIIEFEGKTRTEWYGKELFEGKLYTSKSELQKGKDDEDD